MISLAERIDWILKYRGISQRELARRAKLASETHVGLILRTGGAGVETLQAIAKAAGVDFRWLASGEGDPHARSPEERSRPELDAFVASRPDADPAIIALLRVEAHELRDTALSVEFYRETYEQLDHARNVARRLARAGSYAPESRVRVGDQAPDSDASPRAASDASPGSAPPPVPVKPRRSQG